MNDQDRPPRPLPLWPWVLTGLVLVLGVITYLTHRQTEAKAPGGRAGLSGTNAPPLMVSTATARQGNIGVYVTALGVVTPLNTVSVQSRVAGQIIKVNYQEGQLVHAGDLLIEIDPGPFQAAVLQAQGQLARDTALLDDARLNLERYKEAFASNAIPKQQYDTQIATVQQYEGTVQLDQGNLDSAKVQLAYCHITAPITGRVGLRLVDAGNIVQGSGSNALVIITQVQPITVISPWPRTISRRSRPRYETASSSWWMYLTAPSKNNSPPEPWKPLITRLTPRRARSSSGPFLPTTTNRCFPINLSTCGCWWTRMRT
jgi:multidrug efflux system membrane fusion protein